MRTISASILCAFLYIWYFTNALFLFRSFQLMGVKRKLILISGTFYFLDAVYRVLLQYLGVSESRLSALQKIPVNALFFTSLFAQTYLVTKLLSGRLWSRKQKLILFFQMVVPWSFSFLVSILITTFIYPLYNAQNKNGKLIIALFAPLIGVFVKVISRISVQRLYNITHPGYSFVLLVPLYSGAAVIFRNFTSGSRQFTDHRSSWNNSWSCRSHRAKYNGFYRSHLSSAGEKKVRSLGKFSYSSS